MRIRTTLCALAIVTSSLAGTAQARETEHFYSVRDAAESEVGRAKLQGVPFYLRGQPHPAFGSELLEMTTEQSTRGAFRSDLASCQIAFLSALIALQERAQQEGAAAIVDIVSITRGKPTESDRDFRCIAGTTVVHVGLRGKLVAAQRSAQPGAE